MNIEGTHIHSHIHFQSDHKNGPTVFRVYWIIQRARLILDSGKDTTRNKTSSRNFSFY